MEVKKPTITISDPNPKELTHENVVTFIIENFSYKMNTKQNRKKFILNLNRVFFPDKIAKFIDKTNENDVDSGTLSIMIKYNGTLYNLLAFQDQYIKIERKRKLLKINKL